MTVPYSLDVSSMSFLAFVRLLCRWKGSIIKAVWAELVVWLCLYALIALIVHFLVPSDRMEYIRAQARTLDDRLKIFDVKFMLGFFVTNIVDRWKQILQNICFIENVALSVSTLIRGRDDNVRLARRSIIRYVVLSQILVYRDISMRVRRRFPTMKSIIESGFMFENELREIDECDMAYNKYWMPINWANSIVMRMNDQKYIEVPVSTNNVLNNIRDFRTALENLCKFDWVPIPIAYPQVVFFAVRAYFLLALFARQYFPPQGGEDPLYNYFPMVTIFQFIFHMGWMKVAEGLLNPLGEDDDDFEGNWVIDKNITTGMQIVDQSHNECPDLNIDKFSDPKFAPMYPVNITHHGQVSYLQGSAADVVIPESEIKPMIPVDNLSTTSRDKSQSSIRRRFSRLSSKIKFGRSMSNQSAIKSPGADSNNSGFNNLEFVTEENEDQKSETKINIEESATCSKKK